MKKLILLTGNRSSTCFSCLVAQKMHMGLYYYATSNNACLTIIQKYDCLDLHTKNGSINTECFGCTTSTWLFINSQAVISDDRFPFRWKGNSKCSEFSIGKLYFCNMKTQEDISLQIHLLHIENKLYSNMIWLYPRF